MAEGENSKDLPQDPYGILDVEKTASDEEIKSAFRKLALKYHPDKINRSTNSAEEKVAKQDVLSMLFPFQRGQAGITHNTHNPKF